MPRGERTNDEIHAITNENVYQKEVVVESNYPTTGTVVTIEMMVFLFSVCVYALCANERLYHLRSREQLALIWKPVAVLRWSLKSLKSTSPSQWAHVSHSLCDLHTHTLRHASEDARVVLSRFSSSATNNCSYLMWSAPAMCACILSEYSIIGFVLFWLFVVNWYANEIYIWIFQNHFIYYFSFKFINVKYINSIGLQQNFYFLFIILLNTYILRLPQSQFRWSENRRKFFFNLFLTSVHVGIDLCSGGEIRKLWI